MIERFALMKEEVHFGGAFMEGLLSYYIVKLLHIVGEFERWIYDLKIQSFEV